jgi:attachment p12 family protein
MSWDWQDFVAIAIALTAAGYLGRQAWRLMARKSGGSCGGCGTCSSNASQAPLVPVEGVGRIERKTGQGGSTSG